MAGLRLDARLEGAELPDPERIIPAELERAIVEGTAFLERESKLRTPIGVTEVARGSIAGEVRRGRSLGRGTQIRGEIGSPAKHVEVLDRGRRPGAKQPPTEALELWVRRRLGIRDLKEARSVAFLIARSIKRKGMEPLEIFDNAVDENQAKLNRILDRAGVQIQVRLSREES